ncbi:hypothetical protein BDR26DRAFT_859638 [Obelidium mucronatum]|nr:hypothetical protein BDR26DRAFT_859638 [Obelidium mucronatum]
MLDPTAASQMCDIKHSVLINSLLPDELLLLTLAHLDPIELRLCASVCQRWNLSWKNEFLRRFRLLKEWKAGGKRVIQFDPRIGRIENIMVDYEEDRMYAGSLEKGIVISCNPGTGKVERDAVYFNSDLETREISALLMEKTRIIAGHLSGRITMVTQFISKTSTNHVLNHFAGFHDGPVTALSALVNTPNIIISGGADGCIRIWDTASLECLRISAASPRPINYISFDAKNSIVACSTQGHVSVWDFDMLTLSKDITSTAFDKSMIQIDPSRAFNHEVNDNAMPIHTLIHEPSTNTLLTAVDAPLPAGIRICDLSSSRNESRVTLIPSLPNKAASIGNVTHVAWDRPTMPPTTNGFSVLVTGHADSSCLLWNIPEPALRNTSQSSSSTTTTTTIHPVRKIQVTVSSPFATLSLDPFKLLVSTTDGLIKIYDLATGSVIKTLSVRRSGEVGPGPGPGIGGGGGPGEFRDRRLVTCVWAGEWNLIAATAGGHVRNWDFAPVEGAGESGGGKYMKLRGKKNRVGKGRFVGGVAAATGAAGAGGSARSSITTTKGFTGKAQLIQDVKTEAQATNYELKLEKEQEQRRLKLVQKINGVTSSPQNFGFVGMGRTVVGMGPSASPSKASISPTVGSTLTEQEMIDYAIMLSMEEDPFSLGMAYSTTPSRSINPTTPSTYKSTNPPKHPIAKPPPAPSTNTPSTSIPRSPANPWSTGKSFASVAAAAASASTPTSSSTSSITTTPLAHISSSSLLGFSESPVVTTSPTNPFLIRSSPQCRFPMAWYDNDEEWEDEADFYRLYSSGEGGEERRSSSSLSLSLSAVLPPPVEDNEAVVGRREPGEWGDQLCEDQTLNEGAGIEIAKSCKKAGGGTSSSSSSGSLSSSASSTEKRKFLLGSWGAGGGEVPSTSFGGIHMRRSPRLGPMGTHVSPQLRPTAIISPSLAPTTQFSGVGVEVAPRASFDDEEEELMFVLALSLSEHQK